MDQEGQLAASRIVESLNSWWQLAGVDCAVSGEAVDWLTLDQKAPVAAIPTPSVAVQETSAKPTIEWPLDIEALRSLIANGAALPGNTFSIRYITPVGPASCRLMVISDMPDNDELASGQLGSGVTGHVLERMLTAIGIRLADCYWGALATTIPAAGGVPEAALPELAQFMRHQIGLVKPESIMLLGSVACKALLGEELMTARGHLANLNHVDGNIPVLTTFHPRTLLARPQMKAQAWKDLQMFAAKDSL